MTMRASAASKLGNERVQIEDYDVVTAEKALQKRTNYGVGKNHSVVSMSFRDNAPYADAHDRYTNIEVNYLLQCMDKHPSVMIAAFQDALSASMTGKKMRRVIERPAQSLAATAAHVINDTPASGILAIRAGAILAAAPAVDFVGFIECAGEPVMAIQQV